MQLYKYFHPDRIDVLAKGIIRFSPPQAFNDPFDMKPNIQGIASQEHWDNRFKETMPKIVQELYRELPSNVREILSLDTVRALAESQREEIVQGEFQFIENMIPYLRSLLETKFVEQRWRAQRSPSVPERSRRHTGSVEAALAGFPI